ncbi:MAG: RluA family pseudouridine synthase [Sphingobacteriales bacterium]|nr:MAG: RluA family pseudouridine synthase [Sphingobacteriales bacterium]
MAQFVADTEDFDDPEEESGTDAPVLRERLRLTVDKGQELLRIDKFLHNRIEGATRSKIQQAVEDEMVLVNGEPIKANYKVRPGDEVLVYDTRKPESSEVIAQEMPLDIVYEDAHLLVVNKPAGMVVHPGCGNYEGTLINGLAFYLGAEALDTEDLPRVGLVHRIDKDTSGLLLIAKTPEAMTKLAAQFKAHTVHRRYIALVWGDLPEDSGTINVPVARDLRYRKIMNVFPDGDHGSKEAITHYTVLRRFHYVTLAEMRLETGRTHQIRVHMKSIGHPLFNDATYGGNHIVKGTVFTKYKQFVENCFELLPRQALHARELGFIHPATGERMAFEAPVPNDIQQVLERWEIYTSGMTSQLRKGLNGAS